MTLNGLWINFDASLSNNTKLERYVNTGFYGYSKLLTHTLFLNLDEAAKYAKDILQKKAKKLLDEITKIDKICAGNQEEF